MSKERERHFSLYDKTKINPLDRVKIVKIKIMYPKICKGKGNMTSFDLFIFPESITQSAHLLLVALKIVHLLQRLREHLTAQTHRVGYRRRELFCHRYLMGEECVSKTVGFSCFWL